jgi:transcriptional regulator with XRE-family HTH domain
MGKSKYDTHIADKLHLIKDWRQQGFTERQIADKLNVGYSTLQSHKRSNPDLVRVLAASKEKLVSNLKKSLWQEAKGYEYEEIVEYKEEVRNPKYDSSINNGEKEFIISKQRETKYKKYARPQATLLIFALCNLNPDFFRRVDKDAIDDLKKELDKIAKGFNNSKFLKAANDNVNKKPDNKDSNKVNKTD